MKWYNLTDVSGTESVLGRNLPQTDSLDVESYQNSHDSNGVTTLGDLNDLCGYLSEKILLNVMK
jgi:hypothetical protein